MRLGAFLSVIASHWRWRRLGHSVEPLALSERSIAFVLLQYHRYTRKWIVCYMTSTVMQVIL